MVCHLVHIGSSALWVELIEGLAIVGDLPLHLRMHARMHALATRVCSATTHVHPLPQSRSCTKENLSCLLTVMLCDMQVQGKEQLYAS